MQVQASWDFDNSAYTRFYNDSQTERLRAAIELIQQNYEDYRFLREQHSFFLHFLKQVYSNPANPSLIFQLIELLHSVFYTQEADWTEWIWHLNYAIQLCTQAELAKERAYLSYFLSSVLHLSGNFELAKDYGNEAMRLAQRQQDSKLVAAIASTLIGIAISQKADQSTILKMIEEIEAYPSVIRADKASTAVIMVRIYLARIQLLRLHGKLTEALELAYQTIDWAKAIKSDLLLSKAEAQIHAHRICGLSFWSLGQSENAAKQYAKAIQIARNHGLVFLEAWTRGNLGLLHWHNGSLLRAENEIRISIRILQRLNANQQVVAQYGNLALVLLFQGHLNEAFDMVEKQHTLAGYYNLTQEFHRAIGNRGTIRFHLGQYQEAIADLEEDIEFSIQSGLNEGVINNYINLGRCYHALGQYKAAQDFIQKALENSERLQSVPLRGIALRALAETQTSELRCQTLENALQLNELRQFDRAACLISLAQSQSHTSTDLGIIYWQEGKELLLKCGGIEWLKDYAHDQILHLPTLK